MNIFARKKWPAALIGLDIGPDAVRLLQLSGDDGGVQIRHHACESLPPGAVVEQQIADAEAVGAAIARAWGRSGVQVRDAVVALAAPAAVVRLVSVAAGSRESDLEARLELEAARLVPSTDGTLHLDFAVLGPMPDDPGRLQVLLAVAQATAVNRCVAALKRGGLRAAAVEVEALALARAWAALTDQALPPEQVITLNRQGKELPKIANTRLAQAISSADLGRDPQALLLAYGLALREVAA